jgi:hypothetical protein
MYRLPPKLISAKKAADDDFEAMNEFSVLAKESWNRIHKGCTHMTTRNEGTRNHVFT